MGLRRNHPPVSAFTASVAFHAFAALAFALLSTWQARNLAKPEPIWVDLVRPSTPRETDPRQQIVQTAPGETAKQAAADAFLGQKTQVVDRQTVSKERTTRVATQPKVAATAKPVEKTRPVTTLSNLGVAMLPPTQLLNKQPEREERWADPGKAPQDYVKGIRETDRTALNTKEFVYFGYFQRIRERLDRAWVPLLRKRVANIYKAGRHLASDAEHITRLVVVLNLKGEITRVQVQGESGTRDLDQAAVDAFNQAGPFPNPPKGIANGEGTIEIPWEFVLRT